MRGGMWGQLTGPGPSEMPPLTLDGYTYVDKAGNKRKAKDAYGYRLYDTVRFQSGTVIPTTAFQFFQTPINQQTFIINVPATQYPKTLQDTNLKQAGAIQKGRLFRVISMQIRIVETGATDTTY